MAGSVLEMHLVVTARDYEAALDFYRDVLGMPEIGVFSSPGGHVTILDAGRATLELGDPDHVAYVDQVEVGRRVAGHIRVVSRLPMRMPRPLLPSRRGPSCWRLPPRRRGAR